jgi:hypothetical protein
MKSIVTICPTLFAAPLLGKVLGYKVYCWYPKYLNVFPSCETPTMIKSASEIPSGELITIGYDALVYMQNDLHRFKNHRHIASDSATIQHKERLTKLLKGVKTYAMPDLLKFIGKKCKPAFQYTEIVDRVEKNKVLTISHSPRNNSKQGKKGTKLIKEIVQSLGLKFDLISNISHQQAVKRVGQSHIFIDQIIDREDGYKGGIGKSGLEAIMMGCAVITSGDKHKFSPPITYTKDLRSDILRLTRTWEQQVEKQDDWFNQFNTIANFKKHYNEPI